MNRTLTKRIAKLEAARPKAVELTPEMFECDYLNELVADMLANPARYEEMKNEPNT